MELPAGSKKLLLTTVIRLPVQGAEAQNQALEALRWMILKLNPITGPRQGRRATCAIAAANPSSASHGSAPARPPRVASITP